MLRREAAGLEGWVPQREGRSRLLWISIGSVLAVLILFQATRHGFGQPERHPQRVVLEGMPAIRPGDLVFRRGDSLASAAVLAVDPGR